MAAGRSVLITGAARGLGYAIAERFLRDGIATLVLTDVDHAALTAAASALSPSVTKVIVSQLDVRDRNAFGDVVSSVVSAGGRIDVLINNAGVLSPNGRIHNLSPADWQRCFDINVMGVVNGIQAVVPYMRRQGGGCIINTASAAGITPFAYASPYSASKAAVISLTKCAAVEYARDKIRVNCVCPGTFRSHIHEGLPEGALDALAKKHPLGLGQSADVAGAFAYLAGADAGWTTGAALVVDGGYTV